MGGETYRPTERITRSPPRVNYHRANRSPPRRGRTPPPYTETYVSSEPRGFEPQRSQANRHRSRSPAYRGRDSGRGYRGRPRSPRSYTRMRSPQALRRYSRSPPVDVGARMRSPYPPKRAREISPVDDRRPLSPPFVKRVERFASPQREGFERRAYSPPRDNGPRFRESNYRPTQRERTRSPTRRADHISRMESPMSSHRSSPQIHPDRMAIAGSGNHSPNIRNSRVQHVPQSPAYRERSPMRRGYSPPIPMSPPRESVAYRQRSPPPLRRHNSPPPRDRNEFRNGNGPPPNGWSNTHVDAAGSNYHNGDSRGPPSGQGTGHYNGSYARDSPSGPPSAPISMSAHNRPSSASLLSAPTRPRGGNSFGRESTRDGPYGAPPSRRGGHPPQSYHGPPRHHNYDREGPPQGPRGGQPNSAGPSFESRTSYESRPAFRPNNSSSTTYPRTQRFTPHLSGVPTIVPGGKAAPSGHDPEREKRIAQLENDSKRLMEVIAEKQKAKREGSRDWERSERERMREGLKSELAEEALERMQGETSTTGAAF